MLKIYSSNNVALVGLYQSILNENGIPTIIKNYYLTSGVGELPVDSCIPELWIIHDEQLEQALALLENEE